MNNNSIRRCQAHNEISNTFCETCKRISCPMCEECMKHKRMSIDKFINKYEVHLKPDYLKDYKDAARKASETVTDKIAYNEETIPVLEEKAKELQETITNSEEGRSRDLNLITEATQHLRDIQLKVFTNALKEATEEAIHTLDVSDKIEAELSKYKPELERQKTELLKMKQQSKELTLELEWLDTITRADGDELDEEVKLATSLCIVNNIVDWREILSDTSGYKAFPSVCEVFDIKKVVIQKLVNAGNGVKVSKPISIKRKLKTGSSFFTSLSHNGVLAIYSITPKHNVQLTDLVDERQIDIEVESYTHTGFYDESMVVLTMYKLLRVCSVEEMFLKKNVSVLEEFGNLRVYPHSDVTLLHSTRVLLFTSTSYIPHEFNVDTGLIKELHIGKKVWSFASLTGIDIGVKGIFREIGNDNFTYSLNYDNSTSPVLDCDPKCSPSSFIPSSSDPRDLRKGMKIYFNGSFFTNTTERAKLTTPFRYQDCQSIVRLYQDIFLVYDAKTEKWCLVKIMIP